MGKSKRNKGRRDAWLDDPLAVANADVRDAEELLYKRRRIAAAAAAARNGHSAPASPEEQADEFFNRRGDFYIAQFSINTGHPGESVEAQCVFKADEGQRDYLVEVMRQVRGAFGDKARISLSRARQQQQRVVDHEPPPRHVPQPGMDDLRGVSAVHAAAREAVRRRTEQHADTCEFGHPWQPGLGGEAASPWVAEQELLDGAVAAGELTREQLQQQLPGMTRAEAAAELGVQPADIGGDFKHADSIEIEQLAAELGLSPLDLMPIEMRGGGRVYAVKPRQVPPAPGRHARVEPDSGDDSERGL